MLLTIAGPTAVGKTSLSLQLAQRYGGAIIVGDPRQMYRGLDIGTARPTPDEQAQAPHYLIDSLSPTERMSAGEFERRVEALLPELLSQHQLVIVVGGSTLYLDALWFGLDEMPEVPPQVSQALEQTYQQEGLSSLVEELARVDPQTHSTIDQQNPARVLRALAVFRASGTPISTFRRGRRLKARPYPTIYLALHDKRAALYERINQRVLHMIDSGLEAEVRGLLAQGVSPESQAFQSIGYQEWLPYFQGEYDHAEVVSLIQRNSRRYAKRQLTYWRRYEHLTWVDAADFDQALEYILLEMRLRLDKRNKKEQEK